MTKATNRGTTAPGRNSTYQLADGRYSRFLNGQWRVPHTDLALAKTEMRLDSFPSPRYRIKDHHWWSDFLLPDDPVTTAFALLADAAFAAYDFGEGVSVTDTSGWEYTDPGAERTCKVFVESEGKVNDPGPRQVLIFTVKLDPQTGTVKEAFALDNKGQIWGRISSSGLPDAQVQTTSIVLAGVPGESLRTKVLETVYQSNGIRVLNGYDFLVAKHLRTNVGIFVIDGDFSRSHFKRAISEAKQAGLNSARMYVYGRTATYSGRAICFCKFDEIGILAPLKPA